MAKQKFPHLVGSKWTAQQRTMGWRHFQVANRKNEGKLVFAELVASCDSNVRFWVNAKVLKNRLLWAAGWQTLHEIKELATDYNPPKLKSFDIQAQQREPQSPQTTDDR